METAEINPVLQEKPRRKFRDSCFMIILMTLLILLLGQFLGGTLTGIPAAVLLMLTNPEAVVQVAAGASYMDYFSPATQTILAYLPTIGVWIVGVLFICIPKKNRPIWKTVARGTRGNNLKMLLLGLLAGFGLNGVCILIAWLSGDIRLDFGCFQPLPLLGIFVAVFIQSSSEELICRGYLYQRLMRSYQKPALAIAVNALLFAVLHLFNNGITFLSLLNIAVVGLLFSLIIYYLDSLWCAMALHAAWNFTQNIIFGLPNSGNPSVYSIFVLDAESARDSFAYNIRFGIEGTLVACAVLILASVGLYVYGKKSGRKPTDIWKVPTQV